MKELGIALLGLIGLFAFLTVSFTISGNIFSILLCIPLLIGFSSWGHVLLFSGSYKEGKILEGFFGGSVLGVAVGALITSVVVYVTGWNIAIITGLVVIVPLVAFCALVVKERKNKRVYENTDAGWHEALTAALVFVMLFFYLPFEHLGALVGDKHVYSWLFGHDFINRLVHVTSLSQGLPLKSYFFAGENLSYYWLAYVYPAFLKNLTIADLETQQILQITAMLYALLAVGTLVCFLRHFFGYRKTLVVALLIVALICYSFSGLYLIFTALWAELTGNSKLILFGYELSEFSGFSHTLYRFFLVEPQATLAVSMMMLILMFQNRGRSTRDFCLVGLLIGLLFGVDATNGIIIAAWFGICFLLALLFEKDGLKPVFLNYLIAFSIMAAVYASLFGLEMYEFRTGRAALEISVNKFAMLFAPLYLLVEYGPMLIFGIAGIRQIFKYEASVAFMEYSTIVLLGISLLFVFFVKSPAEIHFGLLKAARVIPICLILLTGYYLKHVQLKKYGVAIVGGILALATPSLVTDSIIASRLSRDSTFIRESDKKATEWIKANLPADAIVQAEPNHPGVEAPYKPLYNYGLIPVFAERVTAVGEWKVSSQEHGRAYETGKRLHDVRTAFSTIDIQRCFDILNKYNIQYIYIGKLERSLYPAGVSKFFSSERFDVVYSDGLVSILSYKNI
ncbi:MAG: hypothetical protein MN733_41005 [Nitrososphaera sp.]|nr:hypothetical protein [Nitrososphaera sp.]